MEDVENFYEISNTRLRMRYWNDYRTVVEAVVLVFLLFDCPLWYITVDAYRNLNVRIYWNKGQLGAGFFYGKEEDRMQISTYCETCKIEITEDTLFHDLLIFLQAHKHVD